MPTFRVTYRLLPGVRLLLEDVQADRYEVRHGMHVLAATALVVGQPRWICALRAPADEVESVEQLACGRRPARSA